MTALRHDPLAARERRVEPIVTKFTEAWEGMAVDWSRTTGEPLPSRTGALSHDELVVRGQMDAAIARRAAKRAA